MVVMANTRLRDASERITTYQLGPHFAHLNLPPHSWAGDGLLAICFFPASSSSESWSPTTWGLGEGGTSRGAFALAALAAVGTHLWSALRALLPTLAAVDDLMAIVIIAVHQIAHGLGRQATLDWKITDGSYRVVVMPARSDGRSGGRQRFRAGNSGRSPVAHIGMGASSKMSIVKRPLPSARKGWALIRSRASSRLPASTIV
jgi:Na+/H+ antiporter 1